MRWLKEGSKITPGEFLEDLHTIIVMLAKRVVSEAQEEKQKWVDITQE